MEVVAAALDKGFLRVSGGVSANLENIQPFVAFSPRKRRCFYYPLLP